MCTVCGCGDTVTVDGKPMTHDEAHRLGLRVAGHVPAFSTADAMIAAGFDEITHVNQLMLGWVLWAIDAIRR